MLLSKQNKIENEKNPKRIGEKELKSREKGKKKSCE